MLKSSSAVRNRERALASEASSIRAWVLCPFRSGNLCSSDGPICANRFRVPVLNPFLLRFEFQALKIANRRFEAIRTNRSDILFWGFLQFPNAVVLNAVGGRNTQKGVKERKRRSAKGRKRALGRHGCRTKLARKIFSRHEFSHEKMLRNFPRIF